MLRTAALVHLAVLLVACADDDASPSRPTPLAEVCGATGPVPLLPLASDERISVSDLSFAVVGERLLFIAGTGQDFISPAFGPIPERTTVYAVGPCGEDPIAVAHEVQRVYVDPHWPDLALGCTRDGQDLVRIDLSGASEPVLLAPDGCGATVTDHGLLQYTLTDDGLVSADFYPLVDAAAPAFGDPVQVAPPVEAVNALSGSVTLRPDEVLMVEAGGDLVSIALPDLTRTVLQSGVITFAASDDARFLVYLRGPGSGDDPYNPIGDISIYDRTAGVGVPVGTGRLNVSSVVFPTPDLARVQLSEPTSHQRLVTLPDLQYLDAPDGHELLARLGDGRWLARGEHGTPWWLDDLATGTSKLLSNKAARAHGHGDDHLDLLLGAANTPQQSAPLVRVFFDDREPQTLAASATFLSFVRDDGRILDNADVDAAWLGELTLTDPATHEVTRIDDHVIAGIRFARWRHPAIPDAIIYGVLDGERTGVWLARPAPIE